MSTGLVSGSSCAGQSAHGQMCWELISRGLSKTGHKEWGFRHGAFEIVVFRAPPDWGGRTLNFSASVAVLSELKCFPNKGSWVAVLGEFCDYRFFSFV